MKHFRLLLVIAVFLTASLYLLPVSRIFAAEQNLIANPSVETPDPSRVGYPEYWTRERTGHNLAVFSYPVSGYSEGKAVRVELKNRKSGQAGWVFNEVPVSPSTEYVFSDSFKSSIKSSVVAKIKLSDGTYITMNLASLAKSRTWTNKTIIFTTPDEAKSITIQHLLQSNGILTTDNYSLALKNAPTPPPPPPPPPPPAQDPENLISNADFEIISADGVTPQDWYQGNWGTNTTNFIYPAEGLESSKGAQVSMSQYNDGDGKWYFKDVPVTSGSSYTFSDNYTSTTNSDVIARLQNASGTFLYLYLTPAPQSQNWSTISANFTVPSDYVSVTVFHLIAQVGSLTIDNTSLKKATDPSRFSNGIVTLSFDDGWMSTYQNGIPILNTAGMKSTQCIITGYMENAHGYMTSAEILATYGQGHEICAHSRTHPSLTSLPESQMRDEITGSFNDLQAIGIGGVVTYAYPYGEFNALAEQIIKESYSIGGHSALTTIGGYNNKNTSPYLLKRQAVINTTTADEVKSWIDRALLDQSWLILMFHGVDQSGGAYSVTPDTLQQIVNYLSSNGVQVVTVGQGLQMMGN